MWKNLWQTNNLEQYRPRAVFQGSSDHDGVEETKGEQANASTDITPDATSRYPKVLITVRSEQLSGHENYREHFLPFESQNEDKNEQSEVVEFFQELRFVPFGEKREQYTSQVSWGMNSSTSGPARNFKV